MPKGAIDGRALLRWILLELPEPPWAAGDGGDEPFVGLVYLDPQAGLSAKGWRAGEPAGGALVVRLPIGVPGRVLDEAEVAARGLPATPPWLAEAGPQPPADAPWRHDPALVPRLHARFPDDVQVLVHDGGAHRPRRRPEVCWVRVDGVEDERARPVSGQPASTRVYRGVLLSTPRALTSVAAGGVVRFLADPGGRYALAVTEAYLAERPHWRITPCAGCGMHEVLDPPSALAAAQFPDVDERSQARMFTARCPACSGALVLERVDVS